VLVDDLDHAVEVADAFAPEHLEVQTADAVAVAEPGPRGRDDLRRRSRPRCRSATTAPGPNHTLPTAGTARFTGGLRTDDFLVPVNWVEYDDRRAGRIAPGRRRARRGGGPARARRRSVARLEAEDG
jgi:histidinol dehydrogenase